jgi:transcription antitermination factor NusG
VHRVVAPLFPRYGFIAFDHRDTSWSPIRNTPGVVDLVRCGALPAYTNAAAVERLRAAQELGRSIQAPEASWASGMPCRLLAGAFRSHPAIVISVTGERAVVSMLCFGALRQITVPLECLGPREADCGTPG